MTTDSEIVETPVESSDDLGEQIRAAQAEVFAKHEIEAPDSAKTISDRARDEAGRFAKAEAAKVEKAQKPAIEKPAQVTAEKPVEAAPVVSKPPDSLSPAIKAKWDKLDPDVRAEWERREADFHKGATKFDEERHYARTIKSLVDPYLPMFQNAGLDPINGLKALLNAQATFDRGTPEQRAQLMGQLARQYNIDLGQVQAMPQPDPIISRLQQELSEVKGTLQQFQTQGQQATQAQIASDIEAFKADPANSLFDKVAPDMGVLLQTGRATSLKDAYDRAVWMNPETRSAIQAQAQAQAEAQRKADIATRIAEAKRRAVSVTGAPGLSQAASIAVPERSLEDELKANLAAAMGRV